MRSKYHGHTLTGGQAESLEEIQKALLIAEKTIVSLNTALLFNYKHDQKIENEVEKALTKIEDAKVFFMD
jgi:hypothetical protein